jgi:hypothetical protein
VNIQQSLIAKETGKIEVKKDIIERLQDERLVFIAK